MTNTELVNPETYDPYLEYGNEVGPRTDIIGDLLKFTKHGQYKAGQEQTPVEEGTRFIAHLPSMKRGWVKWQDGQPVARQMGLVMEGFKPSPREELGDLDENEWETLNDRPIDPWQKTNALVMCDVQGNLYTFVTSSKGGLSAIGQLSVAYAKRRRMKPDEIPVIEVYARSYIHKQYGETFAPTFKLIGWTKIPQTFDDLTAAIGDDGSDGIDHDQTLLLKDLMEDIGEEEIDDETGEVTEPEPPRRVPAKPAAPARAPARTAAPAKPVRAPVKPAPKAAAKPAGKPVAKAAPSKGGKGRGVRM